MRRSSGRSRGWLGRSLNENIHLLTNEDGEVVSVEAVDDLEDPGVNALRLAAGEIGGERLHHPLTLPAAGRTKWAWGRWSCGLSYGLQGGRSESASTRDACERASQFRDQMRHAATLHICTS